MAAATPIRLLCLGTAVVAFAIAIAGAAEPACTINDKAYIFTPCDDATKTMSSVEYFTRACAETADVTLRAPLITRCDVSCGSGTYLSARTLQCENCPRGHFSNSGGLAITNFKKLPNMATSYCRPQPCQPWIPSPSGSLITSGNQSIGTRYAYGSQMYEDETVESAFVLIINVINPRGGKILFKYRVESERYFDGLIIYVNGSAVANPKNPGASNQFWASGMHTHWRDGEIPLPFGRTAVRFTYSKDYNQQSVYGANVGEDRAFLRDLVIEGVQMYASQCTACPAGSFAAEEGSMQCEACPRNHSSGLGVAKCDMCPATQWSPPGAGVCIDRAPCDHDDYVPVYGLCNNVTQKRTRTWRLTNGRCLPVSTAVPPDDEVACEVCMRGLIHDKAAGQCVACGVGRALIEGTCHDCPAGTAAIRTVDFWNGFDSFGGTLDPEFFKVDCTGMCDTCPNGGFCEQEGGDAFEVATFPVPTPDGKSRATVGIRNSMTNGNYFYSNLRYKFTAISDGHVRIRYMFYRPYATPDDTEDDYTAMATLDSAEYRLDSYFSSFTSIGELTMDLKKGNGEHELLLSFMWSVSWTSSPSPVAIVLLGMEVVGDSRGGAAECRQCPRGHKCPPGTSEFALCRPGTVAAVTGASACSMCTTGIAPEWGMAQCMSCAEGSVAAPDRDRCENLCRITAPDGSLYDFTQLSDHVFGPLMPSTVDPRITQEHADRNGVQRYFLSPCHFLNSGGGGDHFCPSRDGEPVGRAFACQRLNDDRSYGIGNFVVYDTSVHGQVSMVFHGGDRCQNPEAPRTSNVTFVCDPNRAARPGTAEFLGEAPRCQYNFLVRTNYACPVCTSESYIKVQGECKAQPNGQLFSRVEWVPRAACSGGAPLPEPANVACFKCTADSFLPMWSDCVNGWETQMFVPKAASSGCVIDPESYPNPNNGSALRRRCSTIDASIGTNRFTAGVVLIVFGMLSLTTALFIVVRKHKRLTVAYERLSTHAGGTELPEVPSGEPADGEGNDIDSGDTVRLDRQEKSRAVAPASLRAARGGGRASPSPPGAGVQDVERHNDMIDVV